MKSAAANLLLNAPDLVTGETTPPHQAGFDAVAIGVGEAAQRAGLEPFLPEVAPALRDELPSRVWADTQAVAA